MSLNASAAELNAALKTAREHWEQVRTVWRDGVAEEFAATYWKALEEHVSAAVRGMDRVSPVLEQALRQCEETS